VDKTCKSDADRRVAIFGGRSGVRVRNTWVICREVGDNSLKGELIPNVDLEWHHMRSEVGDRKAWRFMMSPRPIS
jgi:hypothetical protein